MLRALHHGSLSSKTNLSKPLPKQGRQSSGQTQMAAMNLRFRIIVVLVTSLLAWPGLAQEVKSEEPASETTQQNLEGPEKESVSYPNFEMHGQVQFQLDQGTLGSGRSSGGNPIRNGIGRFEVDSRVTPRRLRIKPTIEFSDKFSLVNETDLEPDAFESESLNFTILDLYAKYEFVEGHHLRAGQFKVPFGYEFLRSSRHLTTIERSDVSRQLFQRDIGIGAFGEDGKFEYGVGIYQGQGLNERERNGTNDVAARLVYQVTPGLRVGASGQLGSYRPDRLSDNFRVRRGGVEVHYQDGPWKLDAEYLLSDGYNLFSDAVTDSRGFYIYSVHRLRPPLDLVLGYDRFDPDLDAQGFGVDENKTNDRDRFTFGLNYYLNRSPYHRIMLNYEIRNELEGPGATTRGFRLRYQYTW